MGTRATYVDRRVVPDEARRDPATWDAHPATGLWDKPGALSAHERRLVEGHDHHTETVLSLAPRLRELAGRATETHERADRSGYPAGSHLEHDAKVMKYRIDAAPERPADEAVDYVGWVRLVSLTDGD